MSPLSTTYPQPSRADGCGYDIKRYIARFPKGSWLFYVPCLLLPEGSGDVVELVVHDMIETLVGRATVEGPEMFDVGSHLDVVEVVLVDGVVDAQPAAVPPHSHARMFLADMRGEVVDRLRLSVTAHQADTRHESVVVSNQLIEGIRGQRVAEVLGKITAVAGSPETQCRCLRTSALLTSPPSPFDVLCYARRERWSVSSADGRFRRRNGGGPRTDGPRRSCSHA